MIHNFIEYNELEEIARNFSEKGNKKQSALYYLQAAEKAELLNTDINNIIRLWRACSEHFFLAFKFIDSIKAIEKALVWAHQIKNSREECLIHLQFSHILQNIGDLLSSLEEIQTAYSIAEQIKDEKLIVMVKLIWGNYYRHAEEPDFALEKYKEVLDFHEQSNDQLSIAGTCLNLATVYEMKSDIKNSELFNRRALAIFKKNGSSDLVVKAQFFLGAMLEGSGTNVDEGLALLNEALHDSIRLSLVYEEFGIRLQLGDIYERRGDDKRALEEFLKAKSLANGESSVNDTRTILIRLATIEERQGNNTEALGYLKQLTTLVVENEKEAQKRRAIELEVRLYRMEERRKNELLYKDLQTKRRMNEAAALYAREREQFLATLQKHLAVIQNSVGKKSQQLIHSLQADIKEMLVSGKDWINFEQGFIEAHSELGQKLSIQFPTLTPTERKICILVHAGRTSKEIARLLHISPDTADTHRTRIRKKLNLNKSQSIQSFLALL